MCVVQHNPNSGLNGVWDSADLLWKRIPPNYTEKRKNDNCHMEKGLIEDFVQFWRVYNNSNYPFWSILQAATSILLKITFSKLCNFDFWEKTSRLVFGNCIAHKRFFQSFWNSIKSILHDSSDIFQTETVCHILQKSSQLILKLGIIDKWMPQL